MARTKVVAYADDLLIATRGDSIRALENYANVEVSKMEECLRRNKIKFNDKKSKVMLVTKMKRREDNDITIYLHFKPLEQVTQTKYLGIIFDQKFRFQERIKQAAERCTKLIHNLPRAAKLSWGIKNEAIATIYKGSILPLLTYGAPVRIEAMKYEHNRQKYVRVQRLINLKKERA
jgi:predicted RNA-binding protein with RPS1 domain